MDMSLENRTKVKNTSLNVFVVALVLILVFSVKKNQNIGGWLIYLSTWILIGNVWVGAHYMIKYLELKNTFLSIFLDTVLLAGMLTGVLFFHRLVIWSIVFAVFFTAAVIKYRIINLSAADHRIKEYTSKKIRVEIWAVPLLLILALLAHSLPQNSVAILFLQGATLFFQIFFVVWLVYVKRLYSIFD